MRRTHVLSVAILAALAAAALVASAVFSSSHREAPGILTDPTADNTDVYAFTAKDAPGSLTVVANWIPLEEPAGGPYFGKLDPRARYYVKIDNTGDGREDVAYRWQFHQKFRNPNSFLYAAPTVTSANDPDVNFVQTYDLYRETYNKKGDRSGSKQIANDVVVAPDNVGPKTIPNYDPVMASAVAPVKGGGKTFVGPADDAFFVDLGAVFNGINLDKPGRPNIGLGNQGGGKDDVSSYNTHSFVLQVPESQVTRDGKSVGDAKSSNAVVGVWSTTERQSMNVRRNGKPKWKQVSRLGNPLINEVVVPIGDKDKYNATSPADDKKNIGKYFKKPELAAILNKLFNLGIPENNRDDVVQALLTGVPGLNQITRNPAQADTLKINLGIPPTANPNRFGVLAGDNQGFPNGRRLADDTTDIELRVIAGALLGAKLPLGDGVDQNEKPFRTSFPYVAQPDSGFDAKFGRIEPAHAPVNQPPGS